MTTETDSIRVWKALQGLKGAGPRRLAIIAQALQARRMQGPDLIGATFTTLRSLGLEQGLAELAVQVLSDPDVPVAIQPGLEIVTPDSELYPRHRLRSDLPLPVVLYCLGNTRLLLGEANVAVSGARDAAPAVLNYASRLSSVLARGGFTVVSGHARGIDEAAHIGALKAAGTTIAVLAEGFEVFKPRASLRDAEEFSILFVSGFEPAARWTPGRAMERNVAIAALADAIVVVMARQREGGSWAQAELAMRAGKSVFVPSFPEEVAPGNATLIKLGAREISPDEPEETLELLVEIGSESVQQSTLFQADEGKQAR